MDGGFFGDNFLDSNSIEDEDHHKHNQINELSTVSSVEGANIPDVFIKKEQIMAEDVEMTENNQENPEQNIRAIMEEDENKKKVEEEVESMSEENKTEEEDDKTKSSDEKDNSEEERAYDEEAEEMEVEGSTSVDKTTISAAASCGKYSIPVLSHGRKNADNEMGGGNGELILNFLSLLKCEDEFDVESFSTRFIANHDVVSSRSHSNKKSPYQVSFLCDESQIFFSSNSDSDVKLSQMRSAGVFQQKELLQKKNRKSFHLQYDKDDQRKKNKAFLSKFPSGCSSCVTSKTSTSNMNDALYQKVQQISWEKDIYWGYSSDNEEKEGIVKTNIDQNNKEKGFSSPHAGVNYHGRWSQSRSGSFSSNNSPYNGSAHTFVSTSDPSYSIKSQVSSSTPPISKTSKSESTCNDKANMEYIKSDKFGGESFSMVTPRHYRWNIVNESKENRQSLTKSKVEENLNELVLKPAINQDLMSNNWVNLIQWDETQKDYDSGVPSTTSDLMMIPDEEKKNNLDPSQFVLDLNDANLIFSTSEMEEIRPTLRVPARKLGVAEQKRQLLEKQDREKAQRLENVRKNILDGGREGRIGQIEQRKKKKHKDADRGISVAIPHHSLPATKLSLTKPELSKAKLREFHHPRAKFKINERLQFATVKSKTEKLNRKDQIDIENNSSNAIAAQIKKAADLSPIQHADKSKILMVEYMEETPPMLANLGMASGLVHFWRPPERSLKNKKNILKNKNKGKKQKTPEELEAKKYRKLSRKNAKQEAKRLRRQEEKKAKDAERIAAGEDSIMEEESEISSCSSSSSSEDDDGGPPVKTDGTIVELAENDDTPFVGDIPAGSTVSSLISHLHKIPIFPHNPNEISGLNKMFSNNSKNRVFFYLCRSVSKASKKNVLSSNKKNQSANSTMYILELPRSVFCAGQVEPQMDVPAPNSRGANDFIRPYMSFHILRLFKKASDGERLKIEDIARAFPNQSGTAIRKRMKDCATFERGGNDCGWWKKKPNPTSSLGNEEEVRGSIRPESVCVYESMMSGYRKLMDIGLTKITTPANVASAVQFLEKRFENRTKTITEAVSRLYASESKEARRKQVDLICSKDTVLKKLERNVQIARYIHEQLQLTPWNLTNNYVECHLQGKGAGMLQLGGVGDPSGRGEGFSFIRIPQSRAKKNEEDDAEAAVNGDGTSSGAGTGVAGDKESGASEVQKAVAAVTGTTADLRKLKMKEAGDVLRNLGMPDADIAKLRRWDRIHMVRELSSRATAHGVAGGLAKFARGARKSLSAQQQEYRRKCDVIFKLQLQVLATDTTHFSSDEEYEDDFAGEDDFLLDEFEKDLEENIMSSADTTKNNQRANADRGPLNLFSKNGPGLNRTTSALQNRDDAAQYRRLMEDLNDSSTSGNSSDRRPDVNASKLRQELTAKGIGGNNSNSNRPNSSTSVSPGNTNNNSRVNSRPGSRPLSPALPDHISTPASSSTVDTMSHVNRTDDNSKGHLATAHAVSAPYASPMDGRQVLRRTTRLIEEDGSESVRIEFICDRKKVAIYKAKQSREERLRKAADRSLLIKKRKRADLNASGGNSNNGPISAAQRKKKLQEELKKLETVKQSNKGYQEMLKKNDQEVLNIPTSKGDLVCNNCGQIGHRKTNRICPLFDQEEQRQELLMKQQKMQKREQQQQFKTKASSSTNEKVTINLGQLEQGLRKHQEEQKAKKLMEAKEAAEIYRRPYENNDLGSAVGGSRSRFRMPVAHLNANLENAIYQLMQMPESQLFRQPVDGQAIQNYYTVIKTPMDLCAMKEKVEHLKYDSMRDFIKDLEMIVHNSKRFNGENSVITQNAIALREQGKKLVVDLKAEGGRDQIAKPPLQNKGKI